MCFIQLLAEDITVTRTLELVTEKKKSAEVSYVSGSTSEFATSVKLESCPLCVYVSSYWHAKNMKSYKHVHRFLC